MRKSTDWIVIHCAATRAKDHWIDVKEIDKWHRQKGWLMVGYHFVITRLGVLQKGRQLNDAGAHVAGHNHHSVGICLVGGLADDGKTPEDNFTPDQKVVLHALLRELRTTYPKAKIVGHYTLQPEKACPAFNVEKYLADRPDLTASL